MNSQTKSSPGPIEQAFRAYLDVLPKLFVGMPGADTTLTYLIGLAYMAECVHKEQQGLLGPPAATQVDLGALAGILTTQRCFDAMPEDFRTQHASYRQFLADKYRELWALGGFTGEIEL